MNTKKLSPAEIAKLSDTELDQMLNDARAASESRARKIAELAALGYVAQTVPTKKKAAQEYAVNFTPQPTKPDGRSRNSSMVEADPKWIGKTKFCPHCEETKDILKDFGLVNRRGIFSPAGWCKQCRSSTNYRAMGRVYKTQK